MPLRVTGDEDRWSWKDDRGSHFADKENISRLVNCEHGVCSPISVQHHIWHTISHFSLIKKCELFIAGVLSRMRSWEPATGCIKGAVKIINPQRYKRKNKTE